MSRVAVVGAGIAGLVNAKVLSRAGHQVTVFEKCPDVGGVWSATRRYPGVTTQSPRDTFTFTDHPMPRDYPEWPTGEQIQAYLGDYATRFGLHDLLALNTEVVGAHLRPDESGWTLVVRERDGAERVEDVDHLVVANGVFGEPCRPVYSGREEFEAAGGRITTATEFPSLDAAVGRHVLVVGYGKSACDIAQEISAVAAGTDVIARQLLWKVPRKVGGVLNFKYLLLTRMGEALFRWETLQGFDRFLHGPGNRLRRAMLNSVGSASVRQFGMDKLGLVPRGTMEDIVKGAIGLTTDGFFDSVKDGRITVHSDSTVTRVLAVDGAPHAELSDGTVLPADLVVCATGYVQGVPFLDPDVRARLVDENGNYLLYRQVLPVDVPHLTFGGYNSSFFSPLNAEMGALWAAAVLAGHIVPPDASTMRRQVASRIAFMDEATGKHHQKGTKIIPFSLKNVDEILGDLGDNLGRTARFNQWLNPVRPSHWKRVTARIEKRLHGSAAVVGSLDSATP